MEKQQEQVTEASIEEQLENLGGHDVETPKTEGTGKEGAKQVEEGTKDGSGDKLHKEAVEDTEIELPFGKHKLSDIKKWQSSHDSYTKKMQGLSQREQELQTLSELGEYLKHNPEKAKKIVAILDEVEEKAIEAGATPKQASDAMEEVLKNLDPNDPQSALIRTVYEQNKKLIEKIEKVEQREHQLSETSKQSDFKKQVENATKTLNNTLDSSLKELNVEDKDESTMIRQMTLSYLKDNPKQYQSEEEFVGTIKEVVKSQQAILAKVGEKKIASYLKTKRTPTLPAGGSDGDKTPKEATMGNLQESLETMLTDEMGKR